MKSITGNYYGTSPCPLIVAFVTFLLAVRPSPVPDPHRTGILHVAAFSSIIRDAAYEFFYDNAATAKNWNSWKNPGAPLDPKQGHFVGSLTVLFFCELIKGRTTDKDFNNSIPATGNTPVVGFR